LIIHRVKQHLGKRVVANIIGLKKYKRKRNSDSEEQNERVKTVMNDPGGIVCEKLEPNSKQNGQKSDPILARRRMDLGAQ